MIRTYSNDELSICSALLTVIARKQRDRGNLLKRDICHETATQSAAFYSELMAHRNDAASL
ncbi:MAG: hypothetical protein KAJ39_07890 [Gammaproteobacteria bacterium]|nr:hypothetical protein [Gammaproteobacteria bacterium]